MLIKPFQEANEIDLDNISIEIERNKVDELINIKLMLVAHLNILQANKITLVHKCGILI